MLKTKPIKNSALVLDIREKSAYIELDDQRLKLDASRPSLPTRAAVRTFDIIGSLGLLLLSLPIMAIVALLVRATSKGPAIFGSTRIHAAGGTFKAYKFRSMYTGADEILEEVLQSDAKVRAEFETSYKLKSDPRVTPLGRHIRKLNLDELPQFINVLKGDMSLVGPRPFLETEVERYRPALGTILRVKPGLTGLWQVSGRNDLTLDQRTMLDVTYATRRTLAGDIKICLKTAHQMARPTNNGAY